MLGFPEGPGCQADRDLSPRPSRKPLSEVEYTTLAGDVGALWEHNGHGNGLSGWADHKTLSVQELTGAELGDLDSNQGFPSQSRKFYR